MLSYSSFSNVSKQTVGAGSSSGSGRRQPAGALFLQINAAMVTNNKTVKFFLAVLGRYKETNQPETLQLWLYRFFLGILLTNK